MHYGSQMLTKFDFLHRCVAIQVGNYCIRAQLVYCVIHQVYLVHQFLIAVELLGEMCILNSLNERTGYLPFTLNTS